jgi:hypothetical protein
MDSRHCDDGSPNDGICRAHANFPKWMRNSIRTLSMRPGGGVGHDPIVGGYPGLRRAMKQFFDGCPTASQAVRDKWKKDMDAATKRKQQAAAANTSISTSISTSTAFQTPSKPKTAAVPTVPTVASGQ